MMPEQCTFLYTLVISAFFCSDLFAQKISDTTDIEKKEVKASLGVFPQLGFSTLAFLVGYIPDGYRNINNDVQGKGAAGIISGIITPFLTSAATDFAKSNFWKNKDVEGSYWGGVLGGFIGEVTGALTIVALNDYPKFSTYFLAYMIPTVALTVLFYNIL